MNKPTHIHEYEEDQYNYFPSHSSLLDTAVAGSSLIPVSPVTEQRDLLTIIVMSAALCSLK
jgi:hypothetical protein